MSFHVSSREKQTEGTGKGGGGIRLRLSLRAIYIRFSEGSQNVICTEHFDLCTVLDVHSVVLCVSSLARCSGGHYGRIHITSIIR